MERELFLFDDWKSQLVFNNDSDANDLTYQKTQEFLINRLTKLHLILQKINSNYESIYDDDILYSFNQLSSFLDYLFITYEKSKDIKILSTNINNLIAKTITFNLSIMMKNGHQKFNISLIELVNKLNDLLLSNLKKLSMSKNWFSSLKHLSIIILKYTFTKFNGFLNTYKNTLLTALYKHLSKANDSYNSSIENGLFKSNYFSDLMHLIDIILSHDNSNLILDEKLLNRLFKLFKFGIQKNTSLSSSSSSSSSSSTLSASSLSSSHNSVFTYPLVSIIHSFSILISLLKSDRYISNLTSSKKSFVNSSKFLDSIKDYTFQIFTAMDTDHKKLKLCLTKNLADLLVFTFVVFGSNVNDTDTALESCLNLLLLEYRKSNTSSNLKSGLIETLIQFIAKLNLYHQTNRVKVTKISNGINFVSLRFFDIVNIIYSNLFQLPDNDNHNNNIKKKQSKDDQLENSILIDNSIAMNFAIKTLNHLDLIHTFLINELDNDTNKLIVLSKLILGNSLIEQQIKFKCLQQVIDEKDNEVLNVWYATNLLKFSQLLIESLNEYILSDHGNVSSSDITNDIASQLINKIVVLCENKNFRLRVVAVETLVKLLRIKPEMSFNILNNSLNKLTLSFENSTKTVDNEKKNTFNDNYANAYLIASLLSFSSKDYITSDFILKLFSISIDFLKKFNTSVLSTNLFGSSSGLYISNIDYERQIISWIIVLGLFNYATNDENSKSNNLFLQDTNQFLIIWKNLLAHSVPNDFVQIDKKTKSITNLNEIMKIIEIKNQSLVCLITYITYLNSNDNLMSDDLLRQINQILIKSYNFITSLTNELTSVTIPQYLENSLNGNKLRIFEAYLKLLPHINIKNEINSTMLLEIVKNFSDNEKFRYKFKDPYGKYIKTSKKKINVKSISEYSIYQLDDGLWYGLTSKFNNFKIDELMIKDKAIKVINSKSESDIDLATFHSQFLVESSNIQSNLSNITVFDDTTESRIFSFINHSLLNDSFMLLYNNSYDVGYTDTMKYPVSTETMTVDLSIELFAISFAHLSSKIQLSVLEAIRSSIFYKSRESKIVASTNVNIKDDQDENKLKLEFSLMLRKKAIAINTSIAIHGLLNYMLRYNTSANDKLYYKKDVANVIIETLKNINFEDIYLVNLNSESIGLCCSMIDDGDNKEEFLGNQVSIIINSIAENSNPNLRAFNIKTLANLTKFSNMINISNISNTIFTLIMDPHPIVHSASLHALDMFMTGKSNLEISDSFIHRIISHLEIIWLSDDFGIRSNTTISSNINFREHSNSDNLMVKLVRSIINRFGPMIRLWDDGLKERLTNFLFNFQYLINFDFEIVARELLKIYEELLVFDKSIIVLDNYKMFTKLLIINNFKVGVFGHTLSNLPFDDDYDNDNTFECFPCTTSFKLLNMSLESAFQLFKLNNNDIIDKDFEKLLWIALEWDPDNDSIKNIVRILMEDSMDKGNDERFEWFNKLISYFNISKSALVSPLLLTFEKRINNGGMYFHIPIEQTKNNLKPIDSSKELPSDSASFNNRNNVNDASNDLNEAEESLTSGKMIPDNRSKDNDEDGDDDEDGDEYQRYNGGNVNFESNDVDLVHILDLSNEQINWKFKLFIIEMLNKLLSYCETDLKLKQSLSKKINEFIRISFISSTSNLITLRISSLKLLGKIIELYADMKDPLYPDISILDQQQAQIMSAITPAFSRESTIDLAGEGIVLSSKFISSNVTDVKKMSRIIKILTNSVEDLAVNTRSNNHDTDGTNERGNGKIIKIGEIPILTKKSENKIKIYILQAWSRIFILTGSEKSANNELDILANNYIRILLPLWVHSIREFAMLKYGTAEKIDFSNSSEGLDLNIYENCWIDFVESICISIDNKEYYNYLVDILGDDIGKLFMVIFSLCLEYLTKRSNKINLDYNFNDIRILKSLRKLMKVEFSIQILFNDYIFSEFVDIINKLIMVSNSISTIDVLNNIGTLLRDIFLTYFDDLTLTRDNETKDEKSIEEVYSDFDKLFELLRLIIRMVTKKLPFIKDKEIMNKSKIILEGPELVLIKKCFSSFIEMINRLPVAIQTDLYSSLMYMLVLIHEFNSPKLSTILLPVFQKSLINYKNLILENNADNSIENLSNIFKIFQINSKSKEDQLLTFIIIKTVPNIAIEDEDIDLINQMIIEGLVSKDSNLVSLSVQTIKSLIESMELTASNAKQILRKLIPLLIQTLTDDTVELSEPRLFIEIFVSFIKKLEGVFPDDNIKLESSYHLVIPIIAYFNSKFGYEDYLHDKLLELIEINPTVFKGTIIQSNDELKMAIQKLVNFNTTHTHDPEITIDDNIENTKDSHIELKMLG